MEVEIRRSESPDIVIHESVLSTEVWPYRIPTEKFLKSMCSKLGLQFHKYVYRNIPSYSNIREGIPIVIDRADGDGSCGYRSLAHLLCGDQREHLDMKNSILKE